MKITIATTPVDKVDCRHLVLGLFADERPPRGAAGILDWRLNGLVSRHLALGRLTGEFQEFSVLLHPRRLAPEVVVFYGLGNGGDVPWKHFYQAGRDIRRAMENIRRPEFTLSLPAPPQVRLRPEVLVEAVLEGCYEAVSSLAMSGRTLPTLLVEDACLEEAVSGVKRFLKNHDLDGDSLVRLAAADPA